MIESIDEHGNFTWHCDNPPCSHHDCTSNAWRRCEKHHSKGKQVTGQIHQHHISHEAVQWNPLNENEVLLPACHCGQAHTIKTVWTDEEMAEPIIHRGTHPITSKEGIIGVDIVGAPNFYKVVTHWEKHMINGVETPVEIIDNVVKHPHLEIHQEFRRQLHAIGKVHTPPELQPLPEPAPMDVQSAKDLLTKNGYMVV